MSPDEQGRRATAAFMLAGSFAALLQHVEASETDVVMANVAINTLYRAHGLPMPKQLTARVPA